MKNNYKNQIKQFQIKSIFLNSLFFLFLTISVSSLGQTAPAPQSLPYSQDFSVLTGSSTAFPAGWQAGVVSAAAPSSGGRITLPTADKAIVGGTAGSSGSGAYDYNGKIGFLSTASSDVELCLALNTTGNSNIKISFDAMTIRNLWDGVSASSGYQNGLVLQYRVGSATSFTTLAYLPAEYLTGSTVQTTAGVTTGLNQVTGLNAFLPAECENQASVQVRWIYRNVPGGTSGSRPSMAIDNVSVQQIPVTFTTGWPKAENATVSGFTVKTNINTPGKTFFVVLPANATPPTTAQIAAGQDATSTPLASNLQGAITNTFGVTEYLSAVTGLSGNTPYDVYFAAQGNSIMSLQAAVSKVTVSTSNVSFAPTIISPTVTNILNTAGLNTATLGGNITSDGGSPILERGTVWKTASGVTISDNKLAEGTTSTGVFTTNCTGFPSKTLIYYKAYATNAINTTFSDESSFFTIADEPTTTVGTFTAGPTAGSATSLDLSWTPATGADGYLVILRLGATGPGTVPSDLTLYSVGAGIGTGTVAAFVNSGSAISQTITGLVSNQLYTIRIYPFGFDGTNAATMNYAGALYSATTGTTSIGTGISNPADMPKAYVSNGKLVLSQGDVYNSIGMKVASVKMNQQTEISLNQGVYIVKTASSIQKVIIP